MHLKEVKRARLTGQGGLKTKLDQRTVVGFEVEWVGEKKHHPPETKRVKLAFKGRGGTTEVPEVVSMGQGNTLPMGDALGEGFFGVGASFATECTESDKTEN